MYLCVMIWAWCPITPRDLWMIWGEDQRNLTQSAGAHLTAQGWRMKLIAKYLRLVQGFIHPSLNGQTLAIQLATEITLSITDLN